VTVSVIKIVSSLNSLCSCREERKYSHVKNNLVYLITEAGTGLVIVFCFFIFIKRHQLQP